MSDKKSDKKSAGMTTGNKAALGAAAIGSAAVAAALLYAGRKLATKKKPDTATGTGTIPSGEPPQTD
ncbi:MAG: isopropylmalate isomerase [Erythrobacter sp.]|nr:isopropylmalate isomerase [Erythrobacter sp.]